MGIGTYLVTRCKPEMFLETSLGDGESSLGEEREAIGTSESLSRLFAGGLGCGRGRSPMYANSFRISHRRPAECHRSSDFLSIRMHL